uniref:Uncharacterized protein n=1 Tax=Oryza nivara TaxID=4536 RepID=A0A0E0GXG2_ORYNI
MALPPPTPERWRDAQSRGEFYRVPYVMPRRVALVGDEIYFTLREDNAIIKYNWGMHCLSEIDSPSPDVYGIALMEMENGSLGFACIEDSSLYVWSRKVNSEGAAEWVQCRVIKLDKMIPVANLSDEAFVVGSGEGMGAIFVSTGVGLFTIELKSRRVKKVAEPEVYFSILPYMSFYTPASIYLISHNITATFVIWIDKGCFVSWHIVIASKDSLIFDVMLKSNLLQNGQIHCLDS